MKRNLHKSLLALFFGATCTTTMLAQSGYVTGDFHQHTTYTDGSYTFGLMMEKSNQFGIQIQRLYGLEYRTFFICSPYQRMVERIMRPSGQFPKFDWELI